MKWEDEGEKECLCRFNRLEIRGCYQHGREKKGRGGVWLNGIRMQVEHG